MTKQELTNRINSALAANGDLRCEPSERNVLRAALSAYCTKENQIARTWTVDGNKIRDLCDSTGHVQFRVERPKTRTPRATDSMTILTTPEEDFGTGVKGGGSEPA